MQVTFALQEPIRWTLVLAGLLLGAAGAIPLWRYGWHLPVATIAGGLLVGLTAALFTRRMRCVEPGCGAVLHRGTTVCPGCGGTVIGRLESGE